MHGAPELFEVGQQLGREFKQATQAPYLVLGESVPGGTTTALALLLALGYAAEGRVSGSQAAMAMPSRHAWPGARCTPRDGPRAMVGRTR